MRILSGAITVMVGWMFHKMRIAYIPFHGDYYGLGNRIKGLANFYALGYRRFLMLWNTKCWVTERWDRLFELRGASVCAVHPENVLYSLLKFFFRRFMPVGVVREERPFWSFILPSHLQRDEFRHKWHFSNVPSYSIDWWFNRVPDDIRGYYESFFAALKPSQEVLCRIGGLGMDAVGVQIRNSNLVEDKKDVASLESMFHAMEIYPREQKFFVSCMTKEVSRLVREKFGDRVVELDNKDYSSMVDAVADMWLLGHCPEMIVSPESTFSEVAWWWGGCRSRVTMVKAEFNQGVMR